MQRVLIATSNKSKFEEMLAELSDLHFTFVSLKDLRLDTIEVEEPHDTLWENALVKAKFFAKKTGLLTLAEDTGLFVQALKGAPGVMAKRYGPTAAARNARVLSELKAATSKNRSAYFETTGCVYDPETENFFFFKGRVDGEITKKINTTVVVNEDMGYDPIFYYPPLKKSFSEMSLLEKNLISHRGKMIIQVRYFLAKNYQPYQIICAAGIIVKDGKMLMTKRRDMRPDFNNKWEFPGGGVENGETIDQTLLSEVSEETGYIVSKIQQLPDTFTEVVKSKGKANYQIHLFFSICKIKSGTFKPATSETSGHGWFTYREALKMDLLPLNKKVIQSKNNKTILLKYIKY